MARAYHTLVVGDSGHGKTTLLREMHATYPHYSVWVAHSDERVRPNGWDRGDGATVRSITELREAFDRGATTITYRNRDALEAVQHVRSLAYHDGRRPVQVIVDEAHDWLPSGDVDRENPIKQALHEDRDMGVKMVLCSQDPQDLEYGPLKNAEYFVWVGEWARFHEGFIRYFSIPRENLPTERYHYAVLDKRMEVLERGETDRRYS